MCGRELGCHGWSSIPRMSSKWHTTIMRRRKPHPFELMGKEKKEGDLQHGTSATARAATPTHLSWNKNLAHHSTEDIFEASSYATKRASLKALRRKSATHRSSPRLSACPIGISRLALSPPLSPLNRSNSKNVFICQIGTSLPAHEGATAQFSPRAEGRSTWWQWDKLALLASA